MCCETIGFYFFREGEFQVGHEDKVELNYLTSLINNSLRNPTEENGSFLTDIKNYMSEKLAVSELNNPNLLVNFDDYWAIPN